MSSKIKLSNSPNMILPVVIGDMFLQIKFRQFRGTLFATVDVNGENVVASRRVTFDTNIFGDGYYARKYGKLIMRQKFDTSIIDYKAYNSSVYLTYVR